MEHYKLLMNEHQFRERVSRLWSDVRFQSQQNPQLFFEDHSFVIKPTETETQYFFKGEYRSTDDYLDLRLSYPESPQRNGVFSGIIWKLLVLSFLILTILYLFFFGIIAYLSFGMPIMAFITVFVVSNIAYLIGKNLFTSPDTLFFQERFLDLFDRNEIIRLE